MDARMEGVDGIEAATRIRMIDPNASVMLTSMYASPEYVRAGEQIVALGFTAKRDFDPKEIRSLLDQQQEQLAA